MTADTPRTPLDVNDVPLKVGDHVESTDSYSAEKHRGRVVSLLCDEFGSSHLLSGCIEIRDGRRSFVSAALLWRRVDAAK